MNYTKIYADFLKKFLKPRKPLRIIFDCSNGVAGLVLKNLLKPKTKNLKPIFLNGNPNGNFPAHGPDPLKKGAISNLQSAIYKHKVDLGVIFDADGDRVFFIDNRGRFVDPDVIARLLVWHLKPKKAVIDVPTGWLVKNYQLPITNYQLLVSKVGHYFIKKLMRRKNADFGAECSGHYYFALRSLGKGGLYFDSGILAAIEVMNAVSKLPYSLADFVDLLPPYYRSGEINIKYQVSSIKYQGLLKKIEKKFKKDAIKISRVDGLTMEFDDWWFNIRLSNTEPLLRLNIEAEDKGALQREKKKLIGILRNP